MPPIRRRASRPDPGSTDGRDLRSSCPKRRRARQGPVRSGRSARRCPWSFRPRCRPSRTAAAAIPRFLQRRQPARGCGTSSASGSSPDRRHPRPPPRPRCASGCFFWSWRRCPACPGPRLGRRLAEGRAAPGAWRRHSPLTRKSLALSRRHARPLAGPAKPRDQGSCGPPAFLQAEDGTSLQGRERPEQGVSSIIRAEVDPVKR